MNEKQLLKKFEKLTNRMSKLVSICYSTKSNYIFDREYDSLYIQMNNIYITHDELINDIDEGYFKNSYQNPYNKDKYIQPKETFEYWDKTINEHEIMVNKIKNYYNAVKDLKYIYG